MNITIHYITVQVYLDLYFQNFEVQQGSILAQGYLIGRYLRGNREGLNSAVLTVVVDSIKQLGEWQGQGLARIFFWWRGRGK